MQDRVQKPAKIGRHACNGTKKMPVVVKFLQVLMGFYALPRRVVTDIRYVFLEEAEREE